MAKNILIVPSNQVPTPNRIPFINYINSTEGNVLSLKVLLGATITFSSATQGNIFVIDNLKSNQYWQLGSGSKI